MFSKRKMKHLGCINCFKLRKCMVWYVHIYEKIIMPYVLELQLSKQEPFESWKQCCLFLLPSVSIRSEVMFWLVRSKTLLTLVSISGGRGNIVAMPFCRRKQDFTNECSVKVKVISKSITTARLIIEHSTTNNVISCEYLCFRLDQRSQLPIQ